MQPAEYVAASLREILKQLNLSWPDKLVIEAPKKAEFGDLSTNAALLLAKEARKAPKTLAEELAQKLIAQCPDIEKVEVAGPGFCNITFKAKAWQTIIDKIEKAGASYGHSQAGQQKRVLVEYVSANPTGPLHVGHGRGAAVGDALARILKAAGYDVGTEYYLNDAGRQMRLLGESIWARAQELSGNDCKFPEDGYKGAYIWDLARDLLKQNPQLCELPDGKKICQDYGQGVILDEIKKDMQNFRCQHEIFFSEKSLVDNGAVDRAFDALRKADLIYEADGALWFNAKSLGDDLDRVLRKSDGSLTYFATDIAYHHDKFSRGYEWLVDVWGADHHGYIPRMRAAVSAMGKDPDDFSVVLIQLVNLLRNGQTVSMSTRAGEFVTLSEVLHEVGVDAARFLFLSRSCDSPLDFDLELAKKRTLDNPVYYVQYAYARVQALLRRARERDIEVAQFTPGELLQKLDTQEDIAILRQLAAFPETVAYAARTLAPHVITRYLMDLAGLLHSYYTRYTVLDAKEPEISKARIALLRATGQTLHNGLDLLGIEAPEVM